MVSEARIKEVVKMLSDLGIYSLAPLAAEVFKRVQNSLKYGEPMDFDESVKATLQKLPLEGVSPKEFLGALAPEIRKINHEVSEGEGERLLVEETAGQSMSQADGSGED